MVKKYTCLIMSMCVCAWFVIVPRGEAEESTATWWEVSSLELKLGSTTFLIDPFFPFFRTANVVLCTHAHYDHCDVGSLTNILEVSKERAELIIASRPCAGHLEKVVFPKEILAPRWQSYEYKHFTIETVYSYEEGDDIGFVIRDKESGISVCHLGDNNHYVEELSRIQDIDYLFLAMGKMSFDDTIQLLKVMKPTYCVPMHYRPWRGNILFEGYAHEPTPSDPEGYLAELEQLIIRHTIPTKLRSVFPGEPLVLEDTNGSPVQ